MSEEQIMGGLSDLKNGSDEIQNRIELVKPQVEKLISRLLPIYQVVTFKTQVVAGENYFVKVFVGGENECIHVRFWQPLGEKPEQAVVVQQNKTFRSDIEYFEHA